MYVFGYGSLMWKQGFEYEDKFLGHVKGFKRRFWHGSEDHRGVPGAPGRVVSIVQSEDPEELVWGITYKISQENAAAVRKNLVVRETGYAIITTTFYPMDPSMEPFDLEVFMATEAAPTYLGPAPVEEIAWQIYHARGKCGPNIEYLMKLVQYSQTLFPHENDEHLAELEEEIHKIAKSKGDTVQTYSLNFSEF